MAASEEKSESYRRIARAIRFLTAHTQAQPSLNEAARLAGLSPFHFQRQFSRLAGVSPKAFVCALTLDRAKRALRRGSNVFDAALDCGLPGAKRPFFTLAATPPGTLRLHDLCLKIEAMTPGTYAKGGAGLDISYGFHPSIFGNALLMATPRGLCGLAFADQGEEAATLTDMGARWPHARLIADDKATAPIAQRICSQKCEIPIQLFGTPWQIKVWQALLDIPEGKVATYRQVAEKICSARAARATGAAIGRNPIALLIPCHRVLASDGALTGYHWGVERKRAMLACEAARNPSVR